VSGAVTIEKLRVEIIESQRARTDLIKWKLVLVAAIGAASLGSASLGSKTIGSPNAVLTALIPFVCLYVDAVCFHNDIRIMTIARFLRAGKTVPKGDQAYEIYFRDNRHLFSLEALALQGGTVFLSSLVLAAGVWGRRLGMGISFGTRPDLGWLLLRLAGAAGILAGLILYGIYRHTMDGLDEREQRGPVAWAMKRLLRWQAARRTGPDAKGSDAEFPAARGAGGAAGAVTPAVDGET